MAAFIEEFWRTYSGELLRTGEITQEKLPVARSAFFSSAIFVHSFVERVSLDPSAPADAVQAICKLLGDELRREFGLLPSDKLAARDRAFRGDKSN